MPTCEPCGTFYNPNSLGEDGVCPKCGGEVSVGDHVHATEPAERKVPWHFWVGVVAVTLYLAWRVLQGFLLLF